MKIKLVVFDMDGTLIDTMDSFADRAAELMQTHYNMEFNKSRSLYLNTSGYPFKRQLEKIFPKNPLNQQVASQFEKWKRVNIYKHKPREGALDAIHELLDKDLLVCLSSNNLQENVDQITKSWKIKIIAALGYRFDGFEKGSAHFLWFEDILNVRRSQMIFIGDSPNDYKIARDAKVFFIALTMTFEEDVFKKMDKNILCFSDFKKLNKWMIE